MAEKEKQAKKPEKAEKEQPKRKPEAKEEHEVLIRILGFDIPGSRNIFAGLTRIKGISWALANAVCIKLGIKRGKKVSELSKDEIKNIEKFLHELPVCDYLKNRRSDRESGETTHFYGSDLDMKREFDIKRLREIKSYRGVRHALKLPVRGQRTRSHFRTKGRAMGIKRKKE
jgi:small subunit ribosomal protein S13